MRPKIRTVQLRMIPRGTSKEQHVRRLLVTKRVVERGDDLGEQCGSGKEEIEPRSYRDVVVNDGKVGKMMT